LSSFLSELGLFLTKINNVSTTTEKQNLIEGIGVHLENRLDISPLASRIYALLTLSSYEGITFEEIRETIGSSKSSTSVNINVLMQLKHVEYYTKSGDRKRYFKVARYFQLSSLEINVQSLMKDIEIVSKINDYNKVRHPDKFINEESLGDVTIDYLKKMKALVNKTIQKIEDFRRSEK